MNSYIKILINENKAAVENIDFVEDAISEYKITDEKSKANYGNLCILLKGYRMIAEATECMLLNEDCIKGTNGEFYQRVTDEIPTTEDKPGSDFDIDKNKK